MPTEFEASWKFLMETFGLHDDATLVSMWNDREKWISAYFREVFCARMTSTQRSESINHSLKRNYVSKKQNLHTFVKGINRLVQGRAQTEKEPTMLCRVRIFTPNPINNMFSYRPMLTNINQSLLVQTEPNTL